MTVEEFWNDHQWVSTCGVCGERIEGNPPRPTDSKGIYDEAGCRHASCMRTSDRHRQEIELRLKSPKRPGAVDAQDVNHLPLFVAANEPTLL
jgi:hypothetical protein